MKCKISLVACMATLLVGGGALHAEPSAESSTNTSATSTESASTSATQTYVLDAVEINSVGDDISKSGISEGFLNKGVASGPLDNKKVIDVPYQVNTISREVIDNQGIQTFDQAIKYFPSAQLQYRGGPEMGRPQTRGFQGSVVGNSFWDGFYSVSTTAIPFAMFESLQVQNGLAGSLYGGQEPTGIFSYSRKRPIKDYASIWVDYTSRSHFGVGLDASEKTDKIGFRGVLYSADGKREPKENNINRNLASFALDFYPSDRLTFETNFSYYKHISKDNYSSGGIYSTNGTAKSGIPSFSSITEDNDERFMRTTTASGKFKYLPFDALYLEGGYQWQEAVRSRDAEMSLVQGNNYQYTGKDGQQHYNFTSTSRFAVPSWFVKAQSEFQTSFISHNISASVSGYKWLMTPSNSLSSDTKNLGLLYDIGFGQYFELIFSGANSWFKKTNYNETGISYAGSAILKVIPNTLNFYFTYADSLKEGEAHTYANNHPLAGQTVITNPYRSKQYEFGVKGRIAEFDLSAAVFQITRPTYYEGDDAGKTFTEQGEQRNKGVELTMGGKITQHLSTFGGVTFLDAKMHRSAKKLVEGKYMMGEPKIQANVLVDFAVPTLENLAFFTNLHYTHKRYVDEMNTLYVPSYFTMDLGARFSTQALLGKETTFRFNVNNLFNKEHWVGVFPGSLDGRMLSSGQRPTTTIFRGYDRTFMLSGQVKF